MDHGLELPLRKQVNIGWKRNSLRPSIGIDYRACCPLNLNVALAELLEMLEQKRGTTRSTGDWIQ
jgi:hypothetical protein